MAEPTPVSAPERAPPAGEGPPVSGLTGRSLLVIFYGAFILMPASLYLELVTGQTLIGPIHFIALILWVELSKLTRRPLTTQEAFLVYALSGLAAAQHLFYLWAIHPAYFRLDEVTNAVRVQVAAGQWQSLAEAAPSWWAPPRAVVERRSFLDPAWLAPIGIGLAMWLFILGANLSLGLVCRALYVKGEQLPFPLAHPTADACAALTQDKPDFRRVFTLAGFCGTVWGMIVYWPVLLGSRIVAYPIPWFDFNAFLHRFLPGASLGLSTSLVPFTAGFIVPFRVALSMAIGALGVQFFGNWLAVRAGVFVNFVAGMSVQTTLVQQVWVWLPVDIAALVGAALIPLCASPRRTLSALAGLRAPAGGAALEDPADAGLPRLKWLLIIFLGSAGAAVLLFKCLIPGFPLLLILPFVVLWSFLYALIDTRAVGTTGYHIRPPYVREGLILLSGAGFKSWFAPWPIPFRAALWAQNFKICALTRTLPSSFLKAALIAYPVGMVADLVFVSIFWGIAPIPSATYPYSKVLLPQWARSLTAWIAATTPLEGGVLAEQARAAFRLDWMAVTFLVFVLLYWLGRRTRFQLSLIGLAMGIVTPIPVVMAVFTGALIARAVAWYAGAEWYKRYRNVLVAGLVVGEGVVIGITAALAALANSLVSLPY